MGPPSRRPFAGRVRPPLAILGQPDYAADCDPVIQDECAADISDPTLVEGGLKPHRDGLPGVNLHCGMAPVTRGVLWATGHLQLDGTPEKGYGPGDK